MGAAWTPARRRHIAARLMRYARKVQRIRLNVKIADRPDDLALMREVSEVGRQLEAAAHRIAGNQ